MKPRERGALACAIGAVAMAVSIGAATVAPQQPSTAPPASLRQRAALMRHHFVDASLVHEAVIRADLEAVRAPARRLGNLPIPARLPDAGIRYVVTMRRAGQRAAMAKTLAAAAAEAATMLAQCGGCHQAVGVGPVPEARSAPDGNDFVGHMLEHQRAADELLKGLVMPSLSEWLSGAKRLRTAPLRPVWLIPELRYVPDLHKVEAAVHALADEAMSADSPARRGATYVRLLTTCAECHDVHKKIAAPERRGR